MPGAESCERSATVRLWTLGLPWVTPGSAREAGRIHGPERCSQGLRAPGITSSYVRGSRSDSGSSGETVRSDHLTGGVESRDVRDSLARHPRFANETHQHSEDRAQDDRE